MTGILCIAVCMALLWFEVSNRRFQRRVLSLLGETPKKGRVTRHLSPHRRAVDEKRRTNQ